METPKNDTMGKSFLQDIFYLTGDIKSRRVVNKKVIINEAVSVTAPLLLQDCEIVFGNDVAKKERGCLQVQNSNLKIKGGSIHNTQEDRNGPALIYLNDAQIKLNGLKVNSQGCFIETDPGSIIEITHSNIQDAMPEFIRQNSQSDQENLEIKIKKCSFTQDKPINKTGPLLFFSHIRKLKISGSTFKNLDFPILNISLYSTIRNIEISKSNFTKCTPAGPLLHISGGYGTNLKIESCSFSGCSALHFADDPIEIKNCSFTACSAVKNDSFGGVVDLVEGGAIRFACYDYGKIENCSFKKCTSIVKRSDYVTRLVGLAGTDERVAGDGGAIYIEINPYHSKSVQAIGCTFVSCQAGEKGGAMRVSQDTKTDSQIVHIDRCHFVDCVAKKGSAVHHLSMVSGFYKWQTKESPFNSALISNSPHKNCHSLPMRQIDLKLGEDTSADKIKSIRTIVIAILAAMETLVYSGDKSDEEQNQLYSRIEALEEEITAIKETDPKRFAEILKKTETYNLSANIEKMYKESREEFLTLVDDIITDFEDIFEYGATKN